MSPGHLPSNAPGTTTTPPAALPVLTPDAAPTLPTAAPARPAPPAGLALRLGRHAAHPPRRHRAHPTC